MAFRASPPTALVEPEEAESSTEELLGSREEAWCSRPRVRAAGLLAAALGACALLATLVLARSSSPGVAAAPAANPVTVRQLLEGPELADVVTDNFMSLGRDYLSPSRRGEVRAAVGHNLFNISGAIRARHPDDHAKLGLIELSQVQKDSVLRLLRHYSDPRVLRLGSDIAEAAAETSAEAGDSQSLKRRLAAKLQPRLRELRELCDEIAPGSGKDLSLDAEDFEGLVPAQPQGKWHLQVQMSAPKAANPGRPTGLLATARRLAPADTMSGTRDQATTALQHIGGMLGKSMPEAPARMLQFAKKQETSNKGPEAFAKCVMENMGKLPEMMQCLMTNCKAAMEWLMSKFHLGDMMEKMMSHA